MKKQSVKVIYISGGETLTYRGGIKRLAERAKEYDMLIGIDTDGFLIAKYDDYLDAWEGLQDTLNIYLSIKGATPVQFQRFTKINREYSDYEFIALERLLRRGFHAIPGGVMDNTIAHGEDLSQEPNSITLLHDRLSEIHHDLPRTMSAYPVTHGMMVHEPQKQKQRMEAAGYTNCQPSKVHEAIATYFAKKGTPLIEDDPRYKDVPKYQAKMPVLRKIIRDLR